MSTYTGKQGAGAARQHRDAKRTEAETRQARYEHRVLRYAIDRGVTEVEARRQLRLADHLEHQFTGAR